MVVPRRDEGFWSFRSSPATILTPPLARSAPPSVPSAMRPIDHMTEPMSIDEYLAWEGGNVVKHEYVSGEVYLMAGVTGRHNLITLNLVRALHGLVRPRGCRVYATDVKLRAASDRIYY